MAQEILGAATWNQRCVVEDIWRCRIPYHRSCRTIVRTCWGPFIFA